MFFVSAVDVYIGDIKLDKNEGLEFYHQIYGETNELVVSYIKRSLEEGGVQRLNYVVGKKCFETPIPEKDLKKIATHQNIGLMWKYMNEECKKQLSTDTMQADVHKLAKYYNSLWRESTNKEKFMHSVGVTGIYSDGSLENSGFDITYDIERIHKILFTHEVEYEGVKNNSTQCIKKWLETGEFCEPEKTNKSPEGKNSGGGEGGGGVGGGGGGGGGEYTLVDGSECIPRGEILEKYRDDILSSEYSVLFGVREGVLNGNINPKKVKNIFDDWDLQGEFGFLPVGFLQEIDSKAYKSLTRAKAQENIQSKLKLNSVQANRYLDSSKKIFGSSYANVSGDIIKQNYLSMFQKGCLDPKISKSEKKKNTEHKKNNRNSKEGDKTKENEKKNISVGVHTLEKQSILKKNLGQKLDKKGYFNVSVYPTVGEARLATLAGECCHTPSCIELCTIGIELRESCEYGKKYGLLGEGLSGSEGGSPGRGGGGGKGGRTGGGRSGGSNAKSNRYSHTIPNFPWDEFYCTKGERFCVNIDFLYYTYAVLYGGTDYTIEGILDEYLENMNTFSHNSMVGSKMTRDFFELSLAHVNLSEIVTMIPIVVTTEPMEVYNLRPENWTQKDEDQVDIGDVNILRLTFSHYGLNWERSGHINNSIFHEEEENKSGLDPEEYLKQASTYFDSLDEPKKRYLYQVEESIKDRYQTEFYKDIEEFVVFIEAFSEGTHAILDLVIQLEKTPRIGN